MDDDTSDFISPAKTNIQKIEELIMHSNLHPRNVFLNVSYVIETGTFVMIIILLQGII